MSEIARFTSDEQRLKGDDSDTWAKVTALLEELNLRYSAAMQTFDDVENPTEMKAILSERGDEIDSPDEQTFAGIPSGAAQAVSKRSAA
jgi:hypothetical protein